MQFFAMMIHMAFFLSKKSAVHGSPKDTVGLASVEKRLYACAFDLLLLMLLVLLFHQLHFLFFVQAVYFPLCWWKWNGQTVGNKLLHLRVVSEKSDHIMFKTAVIRGLGFLLSEITLVGFVWILFDRKKQGIHDKFAHTMVIQTL